MPLYQCLKQLKSFTYQGILLSCFFEIWGLKDEWREDKSSAVLCHIDTCRLEPANFSSAFFSVFFVNVTISYGVYYICILSKLIRSSSNWRKRECFNVVSTCNEVYMVYLYQSRPSCIKSFRLKISYGAFRDSCRMCYHFRANMFFFLYIFGANKKF